MVGFKANRTQNMYPVKALPPQLRWLILTRQRDQKCCRPKSAAVPNCKKLMLAGKPSANASGRTGGLFEARIAAARRESARWNA
ncbi:hypothetical protein ACFFYR_11925 [Paraburkholderia dipogonis]|uniref:hypothetical protein n=1 Tax=Paraburkholderia dipogonis TaxID=1211383 RepID=UPI0035EE2064